MELFMFIKGIKSMKKIIITEEQAHALSNIIGSNDQAALPEKAGPYIIDPEKVLLVKK